MSELAFYKIAKEQSLRIGELEAENKELKKENNRKADWNMKAFEELQALREAAQAVVDNFSVVGESTAHARPKDLHALAALLEKSDE